MRTTWAVVFLVLAVGCGSDGNDNKVDAGNNGPDAKQFLDAAATMNATVTVSGQAAARDQNGATPQAGVLIQAYRNANESTPIAMTTTDAQGNYSLKIETNGEAIDGFLKATKDGFVTTYLYPPYPLEMDFNAASVILVNENIYGTLHLLGTGAGETPGKALVALIVTDGTNPVGGAMVSSNPAATPAPARYNAPSGQFVLPSQDAQVTHTDGIAYLFNLPPGQVTVSATKAGSTYASHNVKAWADQLTTTVIVPP